MDLDNRPGGILAWALMPLFLLLVDVAITRTPLLWARASFEDDVGARMVFAQTFQAMRHVYAPEPCRGRRAALLGNSRLWMVRAAAFERALVEADSEPTCVANLAIFGIGPPGIQAVARHAARGPLDFAVVGLSGSDLWIPAGESSQQTVIDLLRLGAEAGRPWRERIDGAVRSIWPLYRFREFARAALLDRVHPTGSGRRRPERFRSTRELFAYMSPDAAEDMEGAYRGYLREPSLDAFVRYLGIGQQSHVDFVKLRQQQSSAPDTAEANAATLEATLQALRARHVAPVLLLMPRNPILDEDADGTYFDRHQDRRGAAILTALGQRLDLPVLDARDWLPPDAFLDFDHILIDQSGFEAKLARELDRVL